MVEKIRFGGDWSAKKTVAAILFGAIIVVFALWGVKTPGIGDESGGIAAMVNETPISLAEFKGRLDQVEQNAKGRLDGLPEAQRRLLTQDLRRRVLEQMVMTEAIYQASGKLGLVAADAEVKEQILQIPFLLENGRFLSDRYRMWLQNMSLSAEDFERQIRKDIVTQRMQELFVGASAPTRDEVRRARELSQIKVDLRFVHVTRDDLKKFEVIPESEVLAYVANHGKEIEEYYRENQIDYSTPEVFRARDILIRIDQKRSAGEAMKMAQELRQQLTAKNFAQMASKHSEDPGSKAKGGDLGERKRGTLAPDFEDAVLAQKVGEVSAPMQADGGVHLILLESRKAPNITPLEKVKADVARRLISRAKENEISAKLREVVEKGERKDVEAMLVRAGMKWQDAGDFDLASNSIPHLGDAKNVLPVILKQGRKTGMVRQAIPHQNGFLVVDVLGYKESKGEEVDVEGMDRMLAFRRAEGAIENWAKDVEKRASIQRNTRLLQ